MSINYVDPSTGSLTPIAGTPAKVINSISNPNLLDNPWFTVNQRGQSSYTGVVNSNKYTFDKWVLWQDAGETVITKTSSGITITTDASVGSSPFRNRLPEDDFVGLVGKPITISVIADGVLKSATGIVPEKDTTNWQRVAQISLGNDIYINFVITPANVTRFCAEYQIIVPKNKTITIKAVKLELGTVSTLANDAAPNYATELAKCQRYYYEINNNDGTIWMPLGVIHFRSDTQADWMIRLPVEMCTAPAVTFSDIAGATINYPISGGTDISISSITLNTANTKAVGLLINTSAVVSLNTCGDFWLQPTVSTKITFSADL